MALRIEVIDTTKSLPRGVKKLWVSLGNQVISHHQLTGSYTVGIRIVGNTAIRRLNNEFRGIDKATDVLSFPNYDSLVDMKQSQEKNKYVGDLAISLDKVHLQALEYGHSFKREICFLFVHGLLHLIGYDHKDSESEKMMFSLQELILHEAGIER